MFSVIMLTVIVLWSLIGIAIVDVHLYYLHYRCRLCFARPLSIIISFCSALAESGVAGWEALGLDYPPHPPANAITLGYV